MDGKFDATAQLKLRRLLEDEVIQEETAWLSGLHNGPPLACLKNFAKYHVVRSHQGPDGPDLFRSLRGKPHQ